MLLGCGVVRDEGTQILQDRIAAVVADAGGSSIQASRAAHAGYSPPR
jgi:hypothetical protein